MLQYRKLPLVVKIFTALLSLWLLSLVSLLNSKWTPAFKLHYDWLEYTDDGSPESECNCSSILEGDQEALDKAKVLTITREFQKRVKIPNEYYVNATKDCKIFIKNRKYITFPLSKEEEDFPLAYSMIVHHKVQNFERLLRAIYAPQNFYCIHVDKKAEPSVFNAILAITSCFPNVFLDFPLKTNLEMVRMLKLLNGGNSMESENMPPEKKWRVTNAHQIVDGKIQAKGEAKSPSPFNLPIMSGNAYFVASRGYIHSVLHDKRIQVLIEWMKDTYSPDEAIWATIQRIPGVPGSTRPNRKYDVSDINALARLVKWQWHEGSQDSLDALYPVCHGNHVRAICVYGAGDLQWLLENHHFFANKFDTDTDPIAIYCLERYLRKKALAQLE
uniref:Glucosaminyl (N-acetyl) transferase 3, mucin type n=1 Tax=Oryzias melastigma TaxID=30732 RepID=A0A3B3CWV5_ORYME